MRGRWSHWKKSLHEGGPEGLGNKAKMQEVGVISLSALESRFGWKMEDVTVTHLVGEQVGPYERPAEEDGGKGEQ